MTDAKLSGRFELTSRWRQGPSRFTLVLAALIILAAILAIAGLILEYGFLQYDRETGLATADRQFPLWMIHGGQFAAAALFAIVGLLRVLGAKDRREHIADKLIEILMAAVVLVGLVLMAAWPGLYHNHRKIILIAVQVYLTFHLITQFVHLNTMLVRWTLHPLRGIVTNFVVIILVGACLLSLPSASYSQPFAHNFDNYVDHLFTATSATCVTGLIVRDTGNDYTPFGQLIILVLIQLGGLGIVIFGTIFAIIIGREITIHEATVVRDLYSEQALGQVRRMVRFVLLSTLLIEGVGAILLFPMWSEPGLSDPHRVFKSIFHAVSAYCNAGFALQTDNMIGYSRSWQLYGVMMPLIFLGGLGFPVLFNIASLAGRRLARIIRKTDPSSTLSAFRLDRFSLHSRIVLISSILLVIIGAAAIFVLETPREEHKWGKKEQYENRAVQDTEAVTRHHDLGQRILDATFHSISARTAGFNAIDTNPGSLQPATFLLLIALMMIGGSPASTAGGMKTVTFVLLLAAVGATLRHRRNIEVGKRTIDPSLIRRAIAIAVLFVALVCTLSVVLMITHPEHDYLALLFESASACGTVGYSMGVTAHLSWFGKLCIVVGMFAGRLGPLTLLFALTGPARQIRYEYPREAVTIG